MNETAPESIPRTRQQVFIEQLEELNTTTTEVQERIFDGLARLAADAIIHEGRYGYDRDTEVFNMTDAVKDKLFDGALSEGLRARLGGMFDVLNAGAVSLFPRLDGQICQQLENFREGSLVELRNTNELERTTLQRFEKDGLLFGRNADSAENPSYFVELSSKGRAAIRGFKSWQESERDK